MTTDNSRADALTVAAALAAYEKASIAASEFDSIEEARVAFVRSILAASPVEQPAAALTTEQIAAVAFAYEFLGECRTESGKHHANVLRAFLDTSHVASAAPSPADERAADCGCVNSMLQCHEAPGCQLGLDARAASASETGAEGADGLPNWFEMFLTNVCEIPDRNSPDGESDAIVATLDELRNCARNAIEQCASHAAPVPAMATGPARAWETEDGRVISDEQKQQALRDGGASASSVRPYSIALGRIDAAPAMAAEAGKGDGNA